MQDLRKYFCKKVGVTTVSSYPQCKGTSFESISDGIDAKIQASNYIPQYIML